MCVCVLVSETGAFGCHRPRTLKRLRSYTEILEEDISLGIGEKDRKRNKSSEVFGHPKWDGSKPAPPNFLPWTKAEKAVSRDGRRCLGRFARAVASGAWMFALRSVRVGKTKKKKMG